MIAEVQASHRLTILGMALLRIPAGALVLLVGPAGAGKSTFAARLFRPTEVVSSDACRALVSDSEHGLGATDAAFRVLQAIVAERMALHRLTVVDATNVRELSRRPLTSLARRQGRPLVGIVFDLPVEVCLEQNQSRPGRRVPTRAVRQQHQDLQRERLASEGFDLLFVLASAEDVAAATVERA